VESINVIPYAAISDIRFEKLHLITVYIFVTAVIISLIRKKYMRIMYLLVAVSYILILFNYIDFLPLE
jgi:hypothetical protein